MKISRSEVLFFGVLSLITILSTVGVYALQFNSPPIRSDGIGYYAYLPSIFIHGDISMNKLMQERADKYNAEVPDSWNGINRIENGNFLDKYTMGEAVMMLPFFIPAHILSIVLHQQTNGFTLFYQVFIGFAGLFYMLAGLFITKKILDRYFKSKTAYISLLLITFATNLFHYGTYDSIFSHTYSFFLFAAFLYFLPKWYKNINYKYSITLGSLVGLITLVRPTNMIMPLVFFIFWNIDFRNIRDRLNLYWKNKLNLLIISLVSFVIFLPQLIYWKVITGDIFVFSYKNEYFDFLHPQLFNVLISVQKGWIFWSPLLILGIIGIFLLRGKLKNWFIPTIIFTLLNLYIISSWWAWSYGGGFGHRAFVESYAVIVIPFTAVIERIINLKSKAFQFIMIVLLGSLVFLSVYLMVNYWNRHLKPDGTTIEQFLSIFPAK